MYSQISKSSCAWSRLVHADPIPEDSVWAVLQSWEAEDGGARLNGLLQRYGGPAMGQALVEELEKDSKLAVLELAVKIMYGEVLLCPWTLSDTVSCHLMHSTFISGRLPAATAEVTIFPWWQRIRCTNMCLNVSYQSCYIPALITTLYVHLYTRSWNALCSSVYQELESLFPKWQ